MGDRRRSAIFKRQQEVLFVGQARQKKMLIETFFFPQTTTNGLLHFSTKTRQPLSWSTTNYYHHGYKRKEGERERKASIVLNYPSIYAESLTLRLLVASRTELKTMKLQLFFFGKMLSLWG